MLSFARAAYPLAKKMLIQLQPAPYGLAAFVIFRKGVYPQRRDNIRRLLPTNDVNNGDNASYYLSHHGFLGCNVVGFVDKAVDILVMITANGCITLLVINRRSYVQTIDGINGFIA